VCERERERGGGRGGGREKEDHCGPGLISEELRFGAFQRYQKTCVTKAKEEEERRGGEDYYYMLKGGCGF
jgi:hypothetical protein